MEIVNGQELQNRVKGLITEGAQEFGEGYGQQVAANYGQQQVGMDVGLTDKAMDQALSGLVVGGPVGGVVGGFGRTRNPEAVSILQNKLNDLMSQHQTLQDQMQEPHADQTMLAEQLRQNSQAIAGLESQLRELGETIQQPEQPQPEVGAQPESEDGPQWYDPQDGGSATKRRERDWYNSRNAPHYSVPGFKSFGGAERAAIKRYLDGRPDKQEIIQRLKKLADTPWARKTVQSMLIRKTIDDLIAGNPVDYRSLLSEKDNASVLDYLKNDGEAGLWRYLHNEDLLGHAGKPQNSINGSFIDCQPSRDCASFCYATKGNYRFSNPLIKSELVSWAVENDPVKAARIAANDYKGTVEFYQNKALRLFDMGDGSMAWLPFIKEMNKEGIRLQIFSKTPEFLKQVPEQNWRALSVDNSNFGLAKQHPDLPLAVVFDGERNGIDFIRSNLDRILVILPIKHGQKVLSDKRTLRRMLGLDAMKRVCPVDGGWKKIKHPTDPKKDFNCTSCDKYGGMGCFHGNVTRNVMKAATETPHDKNLRLLKEEIENDPEIGGGCCTLYRSNSQTGPGRGLCPGAGWG